MSEQRSREMMKSNFVNRVKGNQQRSEGGSGSYFKSNLPEGVKWWKCQNGDHQIDIIPYFAGPNDPLVVTGEIKEGAEQYVLEFFVHDAVGVGDGGIMCLQKTYGRPCPICEDLKKKTQEGYDDKLLAKLRPKKNPRSVYNIIDVDNENKGVQVWHTSHYLMEMYLLELAKIPVRPGQKNIDPLVAFMDPKEGKTIAFKRETKKVGDKDMASFVGHRFIDRPDGFRIPQQDLDDAWTLDDFLYIPSYEDVYAYYYGKGGERDVPEPGNLRGNPAPEENSRSRRQQVPDEGERGGRTSRRGETQIEEQKGEDPGKEGSSNPCPSGHKFGVEVDKYPNDCENCSEWRPCARDNKRLKDEDPNVTKEEKKVEDTTVAETSSRRSRRTEGPATVQAEENTTSEAPAGRRSRRA